MSKKIDGLVDDLKGIFGESFGNAQEPISNLAEAIDTSLLQEKRRPFPQGAPFQQPGREKNLPPEKKPFGKSKGRSLSKDFRERHAKAGKTVDAFRADVDAKDKELQAKKKPETRRAKAQGAHGGRSAGSSGKSHNPFKHSPNLGFGPGDPDTPDDGGSRHHDQVKCWNCNCGDIYTQGCQCVGTGATKDCPRGEVKHVKIKKRYRQKYNKMYHAWRRKKRGTNDGVTARNAERGGR